MRVLVLGAAGMLGHKLLQTLSGIHDAVGTVRDEAALHARHPVLGGHRLFGGVRAEDFDSVVRAFAHLRPDAAVNCIGIVKQLPSANDPIACLTVNSLFPHRLAELCRATGSRLVHVSTDCVFTGRRGNYAESDPPDADDLYGRSKLLGEPLGPSCVTLRTSMIGRELRSRHGLLEWFLKNRGGEAAGWSRAVTTGLTTAALSRLIRDLLERHLGLSGLWHAASHPISKYDLLALINQALELGVRLRRDDATACDRSLDGSRFRAAVGWTPPSWPDMIAELARDPIPYGDLAREP